MEKEIIYSEDIIDFETNNIFISDENLFYFLITLKKGLEFKRFFFDEIFPELKKFYLN